MSSFKDDWAHHHPGYIPLGYELRNAGAPNWLRFHSLPESKRYADNPAEYAVLLSRQNKLALEVLSDQPCWLVQSHWSSPDLADEYDPFRASRELGFSSAFSFLTEPGTEFEQRWSAHAGLVAYKESGFDDLLLDIADERAGPTLWMSASSGEVFAPYDGGVDLFLADERNVERLKAEYVDWLPENSLGL